MLVLSHESGCDICAEPYTQDCLPHSVPCGHTFCAPCLSKITKGTWSSRAASGCPLCREPFAPDEIRRIRIDSAPSSSPPYPQVLPYPNYYPAAGTKSAATAFGKAPIDEDALDTGLDHLDKVQVEARHLEQRVADAAKKRCTFEELSFLHRDVQQWLDRNARRPGEFPSLRLAVSLLSSILVNGFAFSEAKKAAKGVEVSLKDKLDATEATKRKLELELHRQHMEVFTLKQEMSKLTGAPAPSLPPAPLASAAPPVARSLGSSLAPASSPTATSLRSQTPAPVPSARSHTPGPARSQTPAASAYAGYAHNTSRTAPPSSMVPPPHVSSAHTSPERHHPHPHQRWIPPTTREEDEREIRPGTAFGNHPSQHSHSRSQSIGAALASSIGLNRPRTAAGWRN